MAGGDDALFRQVATMIGKGVSKSSEVVFDQAQDVALLVLQRMAARETDNRKNGRAVVRAAIIADALARGSFIVPVVAGRVAAAVTYIGLRTCGAALNCTSKLLKRTARNKVRA